MTRNITYCAFFAALSIILSQISVPIGPVPINLAHVSIFLAAGLLGVKYGSISQVVFVLLGLAGLPVFSGFRGGIGMLVGPTGGFIVGYMVCAFVVGMFIKELGNSKIVLFTAMYVGWVVTYLFGIAWFMFSTNTPFAAALSVCFFPFLPGDLLKTVVCVLLIRKLKPIINKRLL